MGFGWSCVYFKVLAVLIFIFTNCYGQVTESVVFDVTPSVDGGTPPVDGVTPPFDGVTPPVGGPAPAGPVTVPVTHVRKCLCNATELLEHDECVEHPMLVEAVFATPFNITVQDLTCIPPLTTVVLAFEDFSPVEEGAIYVPLLDSLVPLADHCIEYKYDLYGEVTMEAKVCFAAPQLPVCCPGGALPMPNPEEGLYCTAEAEPEKPGAKETARVGPGSKNDPDENVREGPGSENDPDESVRVGRGSVRLPVYVGSLPVDFGVLDTFVSPVDCSEGQKLTTTSIGETDQATLEYELGSASLEWITPNGKVQHLNPGQFCLSKTDTPHGESYTGFFCYRNPMDDHMEQCRDQVCVRKCCPQGSVYFDEIGCTEFPSPGGWVPPLHNRHTLLPLEEQIPPVVEVYGLPICPHFYVLDADLPFVLTDDGQLTLLHGASYPAYRYCLDNMISDNGTVGTIALLCFDDAGDNSCWWQGVVQMGALALSCLFILATLFVYLSVTEIFRRLPSKCVISESIALLLSFLCLISLQAMSSLSSSAFCVATGLIFYYATLASFFWLNVMCFDMYFTIKSIVPVTEGGSQRKWLVRYSLYGWGVPLAFLLAVCVIDNLPFDAAHYGVVRPNIFSACHIPSNDHVARWVYMYCPMLVLLAINVALFLHVAVLLVRQQRDNARVLQGAESQARAGGRAPQSGGKAKESAVLCLKLFVVMGVTWVTEIISFADGSPCYVWLVTDVINCLRGLFIFLIFVCKRDVIKKIRCRVPSTSPAQFALLDRS